MHASLLQYLYDVMMESSNTNGTDDTQQQQKRTSSISLPSPSLLISTLIVLCLIVGGIVAPAFLFLYTDRGPYTFTYPFYAFHTSLSVIIALCVIALFLPCLLGIWAQNRNAKKFNLGRKKHAKKEETRSRRIQKLLTSIRRSLRDGLYIELHKRPSVSELMDDARKKAASLPPVVEGDDKEEMDEEGSDDKDEVDEEEEEVVDDMMEDMMPSIVEEGKDYEEVDALSNRSIGPGCAVVEKEVRAFYDKVTGDKVVLVLRLALGLLAAGHCTVDVETTVLKTAEALELPTPRLSVGHRLLQAQFGQTPPHLLTCKRDFVFSMLKDLQMLADSVITGEIDPTEAHLALEVCNQMLATPLPYGWIIYDLVFLGIAPWATVAAYYGSYWDMLGAICMSPITVLTYRLCEKLKISHLEEILVPFNLGLFAPLVWRFCNGGQGM